ncbi:MAG: T9SS type A sorting domain-containing protein [Ignavibacteria bacterium]|nr:T9SS type A sorting domain-containing protein [Ignavibacteria bacterium]
MNKTLLQALLIVLCFVPTLQAQQKETAPNFFEIQKRAYDYFNQNNIKLKSPDGKELPEAGGTAQFKRWEWFWQQRIGPDGQFPDPMVIYNATAKYKEDQLRRIKKRGDAVLSPADANWKQIGPIGAANGGGAGRVNRIHVNTDFPDVIWAGTAAGGAWKSADKGATWTPKSDGIPSIGVTDIATTITNPDLVYIATGDGYGSGNIQVPISYSIGVMSSNDGGTTWSPTGLTWKTSNANTITRLLISPADPLILHAGTDGGIYRTTNGGLTWTMVQSGDFDDMEYKPGDPTTMYACAGRTIYRSINSGASWQALTAGIPTNIGRIALAVTMANPDMVYALCARGYSNGSGFGGFYTSANSGTNWIATYPKVTPNILGRELDGSDDNDGTQQGMYDLSLAVSSTDPKIIYAGGINIWKSVNGGTSWTSNTHWIPGNGKPYVHADIHDIVASENIATEFIAASDGGVFRTTNNGSSWTDLSKGLGIMQFYRISSPASDPNIVIGGAQDNGTNRLKNGQWVQVAGGDGMKCLFDPGNPNIVYSSVQYGSIQKSTNGGNSFQPILTRGTTQENAAWVTPYAVDPAKTSVLYAGYTNIWKYEPSTSKWSKSSTFSGLGSLTHLTLSTDGKTIFAGSQRGMYRSKTGATTWEKLTLTGIPTNISAVVIHPTNPNRVWLTISDYSAKKVYASEDAGTSWSDISDGLPSIPVNCIVYQTNSPDRVYVGTEAGVYYMDNGTGQWVPYNDGLPNVIVNDLEIHYSSGKLRAGTFGRGLWEGNLVDCNSKPLSVTAKDSKVTFCEGDSTVLTATAGFASYKWSTGATTPSITVKTAGDYSVVATDVNGCPSASQTTTISTATSKIALIRGNRNGFTDSLTCEGAPIQLDAGIAIGYSYKWSTGDTTRRITVTAPGIYTVSLVNTAGCLGVSLPFTVKPDAVPAKPIITSSTSIYDSLVSSAAAKYQWYLDGVAITGATTQKYNPPQSSNGKKVTVAAINTGGCFTMSAPVTVGASGVEEESSAIKMNVFPNPTSNSTTLELMLQTIAPVTVEITASNGAQVQTLEFMPDALKFSEQISLKEFAVGAYIVTVKCGSQTWVQKVVKE